MPPPGADCAPSAGTARGDLQAASPVAMRDFPNPEGTKMHRKATDADAVLVADAAVWMSQEPQCC